MSFALRQQIPAVNATTGDSTSSTASQSLPSTANAGNLLILTAYTNSGTSLAISGTGATKAFSTDLIVNNTGSTRFNMWWKIAGGTEKTYTLTVTGGSPTVTRFHIYEFTKSSSGLYNVAISATGASTAPATAVRSDAFYDEYLAFSSIGYSGASTTFSNSGGLYSAQGNGFTGTETQLVDFYYATANTNIVSQQAKLTAAASRSWAMGTLIFYSNPYSAQLGISLGLTGTFTIVNASSSNYPTLGVG